MCCTVFWDNENRKVGYVPTTEKLNSLSRISSVSDVRALDGDHLDDGLEYWGAEVGTGWETDGNDCAARTDVLLKISKVLCGIENTRAYLSSLLERLLIHSN